MIEVNGELFVIKRQNKNIVTFYLNEPFYIFNNILVDTGIHNLTPPNHV